jgi:hypothetical protein
MDERSEPRFGVDKPVTVVLLGVSPDRLYGKVKNIASKGLALEMPVPVRPGAALKIELPDAMVLGEAVYCRGEGSTWLVGVKLDQVLCGLASLNRSCQDLQEEPPHSPPVPGGRHNCATSCCR